MSTRRQITPVPKPEKPYRSEKYLKFIRGKDCLGCHGKFGDSQAHHVSLGNDLAWGRKVHDTQTVPLCAFCHDKEENARLDLNRLSIIINMVRYQIEYYLTYCWKIDSLTRLSLFLTDLIREHGKKNKRGKKL